MMILSTMRQNFSTLFLSLFLICSPVSGSVQVTPNDGFVTVEGYSRRLPVRERQVVRDGQTTYEYTFGEGDDQRTVVRQERDPTFSNSSVSGPRGDPGRQGRAGLDGGKKGPGEQAGGDEAQAGGAQDYRQSPAFIEAQRLIDDCSTQSSDAQRTCMTEQNSESTAFMNIADQATRAMSAGSIANTCAQQSQALGAANAAITAVKTQCMFKTRSCSQSCRDADQAIAQVAQEGRSELRSLLNPPRNQCTLAQQRIQGMEQQIAYLVQSQSRAQSCQDDVLVAANNRLPSREECVANPARQGCNLVLGEDCLNPQFAQGNPICANCAANPQDPRCAGFAARAGSGTQASLSSGQGGSGAGTDNSGAHDPALLGGGVGGGSMNPISPGEGAQRGGLSAGQQAGGGGLGGGAGGGSGARGPGGAAGGRSGGASGINTQVNRGFQGGGQAAAAASAATDPSRTYEGWLAGHPADPRLIGANGVDLRQFLPRHGYNFGHSTEIVGPDGITAAHTCNFTKIRRRYQALAHEFIPESQMNPNFRPLPDADLEALSYGLPIGARVPAGPVVLPLRLEPGSNIAVSSPLARPSDQLRKPAAEPRPTQQVPVERPAAKAPAVQRPAAQAPARPVRGQIAQAN